MLCCLPIDAYLPRNIHAVPVTKMHNLGAAELKEIMHETGNEFDLEAFQ